MKEKEKQILREHNIIVEKLCECCAKPLKEICGGARFCNSCTVFNQRRNVEKNRLKATIKKQQNLILELLMKGNKKEDKLNEQEKEEEGNKL